MFTSRNKLLHVHQFQKQHPRTVSELICHEDYYLLEETLCQNRRNHWPIQIQNCPFPPSPFRELDPLRCTSIQYSVWVFGGFQHLRSKIANPFIILNICIRVKMDNWTSNVYYEKLEKNHAFSNILLNHSSRSISALYTS